MKFAARITPADYASTSSCFRRSASKCVTRASTNGPSLPSITSVSWCSVRPMRWSVTRFCGKLYVRRSEEHTSELQSPCNLVCRLLLEKKKKIKNKHIIKKTKTHIKQTPK